MSDLSLLARISIIAVASLVAACSAPLPSLSPPPSRQAFDPASVARGANLAALGNCVTCHTATGGRAFAGGYPVRTPFGVVHGSNITPDAATGIGAWTQADFTRAMREGLSPEGHHYYPAFPYNYFTRLSDEDIAALYAFVMTREPVRNKPPANTMLVPRAAVAIWKRLYFDRSGAPSQPARGALWNRGAYLAESLAHCSACHTPRNKLGAEERTRYMAGGDVDGWHAPALNEDSPSPVRWTDAAMTGYLRTGLVDEHAIAAGPMEGVVVNLNRAALEDVRALADYVVSLEAGARGRPEGAIAAATTPGNHSSRGATLYAGACGECHDRGRAAEGGALQLPLAIALSLPTPANLIHIVRDGIIPDAHAARPWMPEFRHALSDDEMAELVAYLRTMSGKAPWTDVRGEMHKVARGSTQ